MTPVGLVPIFGCSDRLTDNSLKVLLDGKLFVKLFLK